MNYQYGFIETSYGQVSILYGNERVFIPESSILDNLFEYYSLKITDGWLFVRLHDSYYGSPEYKIQGTRPATPDECLWIAKDLRRKVREANKRAQQLRLAREEAVEPDTNPWYRSGELHRVYSPAVEHTDS